MSALILKKYVRPRNSKIAQHNAAVTTCAKKNHFDNQARGDLPEADIKATGIIVSEPMELNKL
jgi:hypothetical protein